jgi:hypothetical protein
MTSGAVSPGASLSTSGRSERGIVSRWCFKFALALTVFFGLAMVPARAGLIFDFQYSLPAFGNNGFSVTASGTLLTTDVLDPVTNAYTVTGITGTRTTDLAGDIETANIVGLLVDPATRGLNATYPNLLYPNGMLNLDGLFFIIDPPTMADLYGAVNVYFDGYGFTEFSPGVGDGTFSVSLDRGSTNDPTASPEPATLGFVFGAIVIFGIWRSKSGIYRVFGGI